MLPCHAYADLALYLTAVLRCSKHTVPKKRSKWGVNHTIERVRDSLNNYPFNELNKQQQNRTTSAAPELCKNVLISPTVANWGK